MSGTCSLVAKKIARSAIEQAQSDLRRPHASRVYRDAWVWVSGKGEQFTQICDVLGFDADATSAALLSGKQPSFTKPRKYTPRIRHASGYTISILSELAKANAPMHPSALVMAGGSPASARSAIGRQIASGRVRRVGDFLEVTEKGKDDLRRIRDTEAAARIEPGSVTEQFICEADGIGPFSVSRMLDVIGCKPATAHGSLRRLQDNGMVRKVGVGQYIITSKGKEAVEAIRKRMVATQ